MLIGIDPGKSGAVVFLSDSWQIVRAFTTPITPDGLIDCVELTRQIDKARIDCGGEHLPEPLTSAWIEDVHAMPGQGVCSMFSFGRSVGAVEGVCEALGLTVKRVRPQVWVRKAEEVLGGHGVDCGKDGKAKAKGSAWAKRLWPDADLRASSRSKKYHDGIGDAVMIAWYGLGFEKSFWKRCGHGEGNGF